MRSGQPLTMQSGIKYCCKVTTLHFHAVCYAIIDVAYYIVVVKCLWIYISWFTVNNVICVPLAFIHSSWSTFWCCSNGSEYHSTACISKFRAQACLRQHRQECQASIYEMWRPDPVAALYGIKGRIHYSSFMSEQKTEMNLFLFQKIMIPLRIILPFWFPGLYISISHFLVHMCTLELG